MKTKQLKIFLTVALMGIMSIAHAHVFWDPVDGDNNNDGTDPSKCVKSFAKAKALSIEEIGTSKTNKWIVLCNNSCTITSNTTWDGTTNNPNWTIHLRRIRNTQLQFTEHIVIVNAGKSLTLSNIVIDGRGHGSASEYIPDCGALVYLKKGATLTIEPGTILQHNQRRPGSESTSNYNGGGVMSTAGATVVMNGGRICYCQTNNSGGGIFLSSSSATSESEASVFIMNDGQIDHCECNRNGGGLYITGRRTIEGADTITYYASATFVKGKIYNCDATGYTYDDQIGRGGGVCLLYTHAYMNPVNDSDFQAYRNHAKRYGGAFHFGNHSSLQISKGLIHDNTTGEEGNGNPTGSQGKFAGDGAAGLHFTGGSTLNMTGGKLYNNASQWGAAIHASYEGTLEIMGGEIYNNVAYYQGGAVNVHTNTNLSFPKGSKVHIHHNRAGRGGAICVDGANLYIYDADIHDNIAADTLRYLLEIPEIPEEVAISLGNGGAICELMQHLGNNEYMVPANFYMHGGKVYNNKATNNGGAMYSLRNTMWPMVTSPEVTIKGGEMYNNEAVSGNGGGIYTDVGCFFTMTADTIMEGGVISEIHTGKIYNNRAGQSGGGVCLSDAIFNMWAGSFENDTALVNGGGFYITGDASEVYVRGGEIKNNGAGSKGGGFAVLGGDVTISEENSDYPTLITNNTATEKGGGIYVSDGTVIVSDASVSYNTTLNNNGGAFCVDNGDITISDGKIHHNIAPNGNGGGVYAGNGDITLNSGTTVQHNTAINGGGICVDGGSITYNNGTISNNTATGNGGGIYANSDVSFVGGTVSNNSAVSGGGLYANAGTVDFSSGMFSQNGASANGGGIYLNTGATLNLTNEATITKNHVPAGGAGGGVYLGGTLNVGRNATDLPGTHSLMAHDNYAGTPSDYALNNIFLPNEDKYITLLSDISGVNPGTGSFYTRLGFSVTRGFCPVVYTDISGGNASHEAWLANLMGSSTTLTGAIFDDANKYPALHMPEDHGPILAKYIWLWGCWTTEVTSNPGPDHFTVDHEGTNAALVHIKSNKGLAWFTSYVNGLNGCDQHHDVDAVLEADVDMSEFLWVPIGAVSAATVDPTTHSTIFTDGGFYGGEFDGHGHTIEGLQCFYLNAIPKIGLFGYLNNGTVKNTFINDYWFMSTYSDETYHIGGIAGIAKGHARISNSEAHGRIETEVCKSGTSMGGLVGMMEDNAEIHSSIAILEMSGNAAYAGGIVGKTNTGNALRNSFANLKLGSTASATGGLVGSNAGTVENCYVRLQGTTKPAYWFAATNTGNIRYCYAPEGESNYAPTGGTLEGHGTYGLTQLPYLYKHRDTQVDANNDYVPTGTDADKQLMIVLNRWVDTINSKQSAINYTKWGRPWQESDAQKPLNNDYPILKMPMAEAVAAEAGDPYLYYGTVDNLLTKYDAAGDAIWMYRNSESVTGDNSASAAKLYIAEDVALLNDNPLKAYVGITLDNSAGADGAYPTYFPGVTDVTDWHMIATPLSDAPIGINYTDGDAYDFAWGHPDGMPYYRFYPKDDAKHGYFPSHRFGKSYPISDAMIEEGNYYQEWDFYSYSEPDYHWINFKRNSASHHHMEAEDHSSIAYGNETRLVPGKGYFAATREETFLQCQGHLNNGAVAYNLTQTSGVPRHGYNLIGNPYQAYLDFDAFADANSGSGDNKIWTVAQKASYTILDEDELETSINVETIMGQKPVFYRTYLYRCSSNPDVSAGGFIHPHQGFFVRLEGDKASAQAQFAPDQRNATDTVGSKFRGVEHIDYPLVNLFAIEEDGAADVVTVELGRPDEGGAPLMQSLRVGNGKIWCHYDDKDYAIAYTQPGITEVGIRFETVEDTEYTMRWSTRNGEFSYLHLIDNKTGADVDCLTTDEYKFSASTSDYKSRFRLVFGYTGIEEPEEVETSQNFAFMMNDELVVTGEGVLQVFDMTGRMVASQELHGVQTTVSLPAAANGVYVLRLTEGKQSRVQKMVISK